MPREGLAVREALPPRGRTAGSPRARAGQDVRHEARRGGGSVLLRLPRELFGDAAVVDDERRGHVALAAVLVVVHLDDLDLRAVGKGDDVAFADRVALVRDDADLAAGHVDQAEPRHRALSTRSRGDAEEVLRRRCAEVVALTELAAELADELERVGRLDPG